MIPKFKELFRKNIPRARELCMTAFILLATVAAEVHAGVISEQAREELIAVVLKNFWGKAILPNGQAVQPESETERATPPVSKAVAFRAIDAGEISGLAHWCELDWESHYFSLTQAARLKGLSDKQVAFVSVLHGAAKSLMMSAAGPSSQCKDTVRANVTRMLDQSKQRGLDGV